MAKKSHENHGQNAEGMRRSPAQETEGLAETTRTQIARIWSPTGWSKFTGLLIAAGLLTAGLVDQFGKTQTFHGVEVTVAKPQLDADTLEDRRKIAKKGGGIVYPNIGNPIKKKCSKADPETGKIPLPLETRLVTWEMCGKTWTMNEADAPTWIAANAEAMEKTGLCIRVLDTFRDFDLQKLRYRRSFRGALLKTVYMNAPLSWLKKFHHLQTVRTGYPSVTDCDTHLAGVAGDVQTYIAHSGVMKKHGLCVGLAGDDQGHTWIQKGGECESWVNENLDSACRSVKTIMDANRLAGLPEDTDQCAILDKYYEEHDPNGRPNGWEDTPKRQEKWDRRVEKKKKKKKKGKKTGKVSRDQFKQHQRSPKRTTRNFVTRRAA